MRLSRDLTLACELTGDVEAIKKANVELNLLLRVTYNILISLHNRDTGLITNYHSRYSQKKEKGE